MTQPHLDVQRLMSRTEVRAVWCPACLAVPGDVCLGKRRKPRESNHMERVHEAWETKINK